MASSSHESKSVSHLSEHIIHWGYFVLECHVRGGVEEEEGHIGAADLDCEAAVPPHVHNFHQRFVRLKQATKIIANFKLFSFHGCFSFHYDCFARGGLDVVRGGGLGVWSLGAKAVAM